MFENIHGKVYIPKQEVNKQGVVSKKKAGRPYSPNTKKVFLRLEESLYAEVKVLAKKMNTRESGVISLALRSFFNSDGKTYKLVEA